MRQSRRMASGSEGEIDELSSKFDRVPYVHFRKNNREHVVNSSFLSQVID